MTTVNQATKEGTFVSSLKRNNDAIKADRAAAIGEDAEVAYSRNIEDLERNITRMKRDRNNMLDLSPNDTMSLRSAVNFDADEFRKADQKISMKIRNAGIELEVYKERYKKLFG